MSKEQSQRMKKRWADPEYRAKMLKAQLANIRKGYTISEAHKVAISNANKGKKMTEETKRKIGAQSSNWMKGRTPWNKGKKVPQISGVNNKNWKGGTQSESKKQRVSFGRYMVQKVFVRDDYTCQICDARNGNGKKIILHVDHIKSWSEYPELRFEMNNCRTVCRGCHYYLTFKRDMPAKCKWGIGIKWAELAPVSERIR